MKQILGMLIVLGWLLAGTADTQEKKEIDKFAGTWSVSELLYNGKEHKLKINFVFKGNEATVEADDRVKAEYAKLKFKIDPSTTPKIFDITVAGGVQNGAAMEGIYEFKGQELRICLKVFGNERPSEFASPEGSSVAFLVLKKANP